MERSLCTRRLYKRLIRINVNQTLKLKSLSEEVRRASSVLNKISPQKPVATDRLGSFKSHFLYKQHFECQGLKDFDIPLFSEKVEEELDYLSDNEVAHRGDNNIFTLIRTANRLEKELEGLSQIMIFVKSNTSERLKQIKSLLLEDNSKSMGFFDRLLKQKNTETKILIKTIFEDFSKISRRESLIPAKNNMQNNNFEEFNKVFHPVDTKLSQLSEESENDCEESKFENLDRYLLSPVAMTSSSHLNQNDQENLFTKTGKEERKSLSNGQA